MPPARAVSKGVLALNEIATLISTIGFPIAACIALGWYVSKQLEKFRDTVENNTRAIIELLAYLKKERE